MVVGAEREGMYSIWVRDTSIECRQQKGQRSHRPASALQASSRLASPHRFAAICLSHAQHYNLRYRYWLAVKFSFRLDNDREPYFLLIHLKASLVCLVLMQQWTKSKLPCNGFQFLLVEKPPEWQARVPSRCVLLLKLSVASRSLDSGMHGC